MLQVKPKSIAVAVLTALLLASCADDGRDGVDGANGSDGAPGTDGQDLTPVAKLTRLATVPLGAEITGLFKTDNGELFFNVQHPSDSLPAPENDAAVGIWKGLDLDALNPRITDLSVPTTTAEKQMVRVVDGEYQVLGRAGDTYGGALAFGLGAIVKADGSQDLKASQDPDFNAFISTSVDGSQGMLFTAWEDRPGAMSRLTLARAADGNWSVTDAKNIDFASVQGTLINCFGTLSPWGTPLTSEENYEAENTVRWNDATYSTGYPNNADIDRLTDYLGGQFPNPYRYGYIVEITNPTSATPVPVKHFTLGRMAHENAVVMPDLKTVYLTDDGSRKGFFKFVADNKGDLSAGTLYAAKVKQDATKDAAKAGFNIEWIELAHATNAELETWIASYDGIDRGDYVDGSTSYVTDAEITTWAAGGGADDRYAFIETLRAAKAKGATVEFNKMEGINIHFNGVANNSIPFMYVAMSAIDGAMADTSGDIQLNGNKCGAVYRLGVHADYNVTRMDPVVVGGPYDGTLTVNKCSVDGISNPDNLVVLNDGRVIIGEDSGLHENNMIWVYNPKGE
ncbi:PhoX family protein [Permianibacter aggregans]|uniref:Cell surface protein n=1 Tax=Permianibacter aggregans TaxID=1510150 RepID=A0A4R6UKU1_9GAMM|nr:alkaline phosphatase PhoX [Permianibacter aggregans]QGX39177.1 DUF839 domain-containing protein [Permianibacter aggregans]TDQ47608.1 hypothetical protein EV696_10910 [Permianibacter aggregans]